MQPGMTHWVVDDDSTPPLSVSGEVKKSIMIINMVQGVTEQNGRSLRKKINNINH